MKGRPVRGFFGGLLLGIFVDIDLVFGGVVKLDSVIITILPVALLVIGLLLGIWAPIGRSSGAAASQPAPVPAAAPSNVTTVPASAPPEPAPTADPAPPATEETPPI
jgi:hypothetical protein